MIAWLQRAILRYSSHETLHGVDVAVFLPGSRAERSLIFGKLEDALGLISTYAPLRFTMLSRDLHQILVLGRPDATAQYDPDYKLCELYVDWVKRDDVTAELVASAIVHEAEHARLWRLGFGYPLERQARLERICHRAERVFGRRLPNGDEVVTQAASGMLLEADFYGHAQRIGRERGAIEQLADGNMLVRPLLWVYDARAWFWKRRSRRAAQQGDEADEAREG